LDWGFGPTIGSMSRVFAPKASVGLPAANDIPEFSPPEAEEVTHFSCKLKWKKINDKKFKYLIEELKDQDNITLIYAGFGDECKVEDLDSLRTYKFRLTVEIDGSKISTSSDWISITTNKEPFSIALLNKAVKRDDGVKVRTILMTETSLDINGMDEKGFTPLMTAATYNAVECLDVLLEFDPDLDVINPSGKTALMLACQSGHIEITIRLLDEDAGLTAGEGSSTPLHWAVDSNSVSIVRRLIEYDCDVNAIDETSSWTPLIRLASVTGHAGVGQELVDNGADVDIEDEEGKTALMQATVNNHHELVKVLLDAGADPDKQNKTGRSSRDIAIAFDKRLVMQHFDAV